MKNWLLWLIIGVISIIGGVMALANPIAATIAAERLAGWTFLIVGLLQVFTAWQAFGFGAKLWAGLSGAFGVFVGVSLLHNPLVGVISLTTLVAVLFLATGFAKVFVSLALRGTAYFIPVLVSGLLSLALAAMIISNYPLAATKALGILLAVELISNGVALATLALSRKASPIRKGDARAS